MFIVKSIVAGMVVCFAFGMAAEARAQPIEPITRDDYQGAARELIELEAKCWNGVRGSHTEYTNAWADLLGRVTTLGIRSPSVDQVALDDKFHRGFIPLASCPPKKGAVARDREAWALSSHGAFVSVMIPEAGYGVEIIPGSERFAAKTDNNLQGYTVGVGIKQKDSDFQITYFFTSADGSSSGQIASGTGNVGIVYNDFSPGGSTGIAISASGLDVQTEMQYQSHKVELARIVNVAVWGGRRKPQRVDIGVGARFDNIDNMAMVTTPTFSNISSLSYQFTKEKSFFFSAATSIKITEFEFGRGFPASTSFPE